MSAWTFLAQRAITKEWLDWDLPLDLDHLEWELSGPGSLRATVAPDVGGLRGPDGRLILEEWGTLLYAESGGEIRWGGIIVSSSFEDDVWQIEAAGFGTYPHARLFESDIQTTAIDPIEVHRVIWSRLQESPDGDLGVQVVGDRASGVRLGADAIPESAPDARDGEEAKPYELVWWEAPNCGEEIDTLAKTTPFDWTERHYWADGAREDVRHEIVVAYPRAGTRRDDLVFVQGDNVTSVLTIDSNGDDFANVIVGLGAGEGRAMLRRETGVRDGRLRRVSTLSDKSVSDAARMDALIAAELAARSAALRITSLDVVDHPNAPLGSWQLGDDVLVRASLPWLGEVEMRVRIVGWSLTGEDTATLSVERSDLFSFGGSTQ